MSTPVIELLPVAEVAKRMRVTPRHILNLVAAGKLAAVNISAGGRRPRLRITTTELAAFAKREQI